MTPTVAASTSPGLLIYAVVPPETIGGATEPVGGAGSHIGALRRSSDLPQYAGAHTGSDGGRVTWF